MLTSKPDTSAGFRPTVSLNPDTAYPSLDCLRADGRLDASLLSPALQQVLLREARVRNIVSSMLIEGEVVALDRALRVMDSRAPETANERAVLQLGAVYDRIWKGGFVTLSVSSLESLHREIFEDVLPGSIAGILKQRQNAIVDGSTGRILFLPTPPDRVEKELASLFTWFEENQLNYPPPVVAGLFFAEFQAIHPFADGNGRTGRILNLSLLKQLRMKNAPLVPLDSRFFRSRSRYYEMLATTNSGRRYDLWLRYFVGELHRAYKLALTRTDLRPVVERYEGRVARDLLTWILSGTGGWFSHGDFPNPAGFSIPAVTKALKRLADDRILMSRGERRGRRYRVSPAFLASLEQGRP